MKPKVILSPKDKPLGRKVNMAGRIVSRPTVIVVNRTGEAVAVKESGRRIVIGGDS